MTLDDIKTAEFAANEAQVAFSKTEAGKAVILRLYNAIETAMRQGQLIFGFHTADYNESLICKKILRDKGYDVDIVSSTYVNVQFRA